MRVQLFAKMDPTVEVCEGMSTLIMPWHPSLFDPKGAFLHMCRQGSLPRPQEWAPYLFTSTELSFCHWLCPWSVWVRTKLQFYFT